MSGVRVPGLVLLAVALTVAVVPRLREQARLQWATVAQLRGASEDSRDAQQRDPILPWLRAYRAECLGFVANRFPGDAEMLVAAGSLASHQESARTLLRRVADSDGRPFTWAAYVDAVLTHGPRYERIGTVGVDPADSAAVAEVERAIADRGIPTSLSLGDADAIREAAAGWREADPGNSVPLGIEAWCLYGLHRDADALARWEKAASARFGSGYVAERARAARRLLLEMGMPLPEAIIAAGGAFRAPSFSRMSACAAAAHYEGRRAQMAGRAGEAVRWWKASADVGQHMQESAQTATAFRAGIGIQNVGAAPSWRWLSDSVTGIRGGRLMMGRIWYGPQHDFYVGQVGEPADAQLRDDLVRSYVRAKTAAPFLGETGVEQGHSRAGEIFVFGELMAAAMIVMSLLFVALGTWRPRPADAAANLPLIWGLLVSVLTLVAAALAAGIVVGLAHPGPISSLLVPSAGHLIAGASGSVVIGLVLPLAAAPFRRGGAARLWTVWRGNLRRTLPLTIALGALLYLTLGLAAVHLRGRWVREQTTPDVGDIERIRRLAPGMWDHPPVPPGSWRAEYPPAPGQGRYTSRPRSEPTGRGPLRGRGAAREAPNSR